MLNKGGKNMTKYCIEYTARLWVDAEDESDAREKANEITSQCNGLDFDYPDVEVQ